MKVPMPRLNLLTLFIVLVFAALTLLSTSLQPQYDGSGLLRNLLNIQASKREPSSELSRYSPFEAPVESVPNSERVQDQEEVSPASPSALKVEAASPAEDDQSPDSNKEETPVDPRAAAESIIQGSSARIFFAADSTTLNDSALSVLRGTASLLEQHPELWILVQGFADSLGDPRTNRIFSRLRADAVTEELRELGVPPSKLRIRSLSEWPEPDGEVTAESRRLNRRVEITFYRGEEIVSPGAPD